MEQVLDLDAMLDPGGGCEHQYQCDLRNTWRARAASVIDGSCRDCFG